MGTRIKYNFSIWIAKFITINTPHETKLVQNFEGIRLLSLALENTIQIIQIGFNIFRPAHTNRIGITLQQAVG